MQFVDLKKHKMGARELQLFARAAGGAAKLVDRDNVNAMSHPVAHTDNEEIILGYLLEKPEFISQDMVHPSLEGISQIADRWHAFMKPRLPEELLC